MIVRCLAASLLLGATCGTTLAGQTVTVQGWNFCEAGNSGGCQPKDELAKVQAYTDDGSDAGRVDMRKVAIHGNYPFDPDYNFVQLERTGCGADKKQACWVDQSLVVVEYCKKGTLAQNGLGQSASQMATAMGSGAGCIQ